MRDIKNGLADCIGGAVLVAIGGTFAVGATNYQLFGQGGRIGPGAMPFVAGVLLILFGGLVGGGALWRLGRSSRKMAEQVPERSGGEEREQAAGSKAGSRAVAYVFGLTLATILLVPVLGFSLSFGLLVFTLATAVERESLLIGLVLSIGGVVVTWVLFGLLLQVPLPQGLFEMMFGG